MIGSCRATCRDGNDCRTRGGECDQRHRVHL